jgi:hypothetical protein
MQTGRLFCVSDSGQILRHGSEFYCALDRRADMIYVKCFNLRGIRQPHNSTFVLSASVFVPIMMSLSADIFLYSVIFPSNFLSSHIRVCYMRISYILRDIKYSINIMASVKATSLVCRYRDIVVLFTVMLSLKTTIVHWYYQRYCTD